jgi:hypothetical protein
VPKECFGYFADFLGLRRERDEIPNR